jgi:hypothetical protein
LGNIPPEPTYFSTGDSPPKRGIYASQQLFIGVGCINPVEHSVLLSKSKKRPEHEEQSNLPIIFHQEFGIARGFGPIAFL